MKKYLLNVFVFAYRQSLVRVQELIFEVLDENPF